MIGIEYAVAAFLVGGVGGFIAGALVYRKNAAKAEEKLAVAEREIDEAKSKISELAGKITGR